MTRLRVLLDDRLAAELERQVPPRSRSEFVRAAIRRALDAEVELRIADAYRRTPDVGSVPFDRRLWTPSKRKARRRSET